MTKYAKIENDVVKVISYPPAEGFVEVADNVFADMVLQPDGSYDYTDEFKAEHQPVETYADKRRKEYPAIVDQLDDIYHNGVDGWKATIKVTKDKYPKP
jgi:hypothetical protein|tara:strand:+ start:565 stop:861 length:297 start_codon:yes stop_codon:yes gene_type:complete